MVMASVRVCCSARSARCSADFTRALRSTSAHSCLPYCCKLLHAFLIAVVIVARSRSHSKSALDSFTFSGSKTFPVRLFFSGMYSASMGCSGCCNASWMVRLTEFWSRRVSRSARTSSISALAATIAWACSAATASNCCFSAESASTDSLICLHLYSRTERCFWEGDFTSRSMIIPRSLHKS